VSKLNQKRKEAILKKLLPPHNQPVSLIAKEEQLNKSTLYTWLKQARDQGLLVAGSQAKNTHNWSNDAKLTVIIETAAMNAQERSEYCRQKGLFVEQITQWKHALTQTKTQPTDEQNALKEAQAQIKKLQKELKRKDKALAEAAALLVLQKKYRALLEDEA
jgi:transposase-like protein